jgi:hypothetical protein
MSDSFFSFLMGLLIGIWIAVISLSLMTYENGYKDGQIDAIINGNIKYELIKQGDGSTKWEKIKE